MSEEKKLSLAQIEDQFIGDVEEESWLNFQNIFTIFILNWKWFALSLVVFMAGAVLYLRYTTPIYSVSAKMLIKDDKQNRRNGNNMLANMQDLGIMTNSFGFENEMEILQSRVLLRDAVKELKLYTDYFSKGTIKEQIIYGSQPFTVDIDELSLDSMDLVLLEESRSIEMDISQNENTIKVEGKLLKNGKVLSVFNFEPKQLPSTYKTQYGILTFTRPPKSHLPGTEGEHEWKAVIRPPMQVARGYLANMDVASTSKLTSIAEITLNDANVRRGLDFLNQLAISYNHQANADKNEIALKTEEFINERINKINEELGNTEGTLEKYKKQNTVTQLEMDATQSLQMSSEYSSKLSEANSQILLLDYLREFVDNPANQYKIIPSNVGMTDQASTTLISNYNQVVQDRNRLLKVASEQAPQVVALTSTLDELQSSIRTALMQARRSADIQRQGIQKQYAKYQGRLGSTPEQERVLTEIGRQQEVRSGLYLMLLQKREENSISLAATADKGKLIDEPQLVGKVKPKSAIIMIVSLILGLGLPLAIFLLLKLLQYQLEGHDDLEKLTKLPIIADVPVASEHAKSAAGIVVRENQNNQMDEVFRPDEEKKKLKDQTEKIRQEVESLKNVDISAKMREDAETVTDAARNHAEAALDDLKKVEQGLNQMAKELKDKASDGLEQFKSAGNEVKEKLADVFEAGKKKAEETRKDAALAKFLADNGIEESAKKIETERANAVRNAATETAEKVCNVAEKVTDAAEKAEETVSAAAQNVSDAAEKAEEAVQTVAETVQNAADAVTMAEPEIMPEMDE